MSCLINRYKQDAKKRDLEWSLTRDEFRFLTESNCQFCNLSPKQTIKGHRSNGAYIFNGIDRLNPNEGYNYSNCFPCCKDCNYAKRDKTLSEFLNWIERASQYLKKVGDIKC